MVTISDIRLHKVMVTIISTQCNYTLTICLVRNACMPFTSKSIRCGDASYFSLFQLNSWKTQTTTTTTDRGDRSETKTTTSVPCKDRIIIITTGLEHSDDASNEHANNSTLLLYYNISISLFDSSVIPTTYSSATNHDCQSLFIYYYYPRHHKGICTGS